MKTAIIRQSRGERLAARFADVGRRPNSFIGLPDPVGHSWFIVKTNPQCEMLAVETILRAGFHAYAPVYRRRLYDPRSQKRICRTSPFIVGYVFVLLPNDDVDFGLVRDCDGVQGILPLAEGMSPIAFPNREIEVLRRMEATAWLGQDLAFRSRRRNWLKGRGVKVGKDRPVIASGAFEGFVSAILRLEGRKAARVVTQVFGKLEEVVVPLDDLLSAA